VWGLISRQWFLLALVISLAIGFGLTDAVRPLAASSVVRSMLTASVLFLMGLTLQADSIRRNLRSPGPSLLAIGVNVFLVPLLALPALWLLSPEMAGGMIVTSLVPSTLASAAVWTRKAGGDDAAAMVVSVVTNLACFLVAPFGLWLILGRFTEISPRDQVVSLLLWVVIPMVLGQVVRRIALENWATLQRNRLSTLAQIGILVMVCFGSVASADRMAGRVESGAGEIVAVGAMAISVHVVAFALAILAARAIHAPPAAQIAVGISGSQKTLMVGLQIGLDFGVSILPMIIYHVGQLMIDTVIVQHWAKRYPADAQGGSVPQSSPRAKTTFAPASTADSSADRNP